MKYTFLVFSLTIASILFGQEAYITVNQDSISLNQFKKDYKNNIEAEGFNKAINTYIDFTLLLQASNQNKIDTTKAFKALFQQNIKPIVDSYLLSDDVTQKELPKIWNNFKTDKKISVYGIGIRNPYNKILVREKSSLINNMYKYVCKGEEIPLKETKKIDETNINEYWIRPFSIDKEIERVAYETKVGSCSAIKDGNNKMYFVKVLEERPNTGTFQLEYIWASQEKKIQEAYAKIKNGEKWHKVQSNYKSQNNDVKNFYKEDVPEELLKTFNQLKEREVSEPFKYKENWYIVKLNLHEKCNELNNCKDWFAQKLKTTDYKKLYQENNLNTAKEKVKLTENKEAINEVLNTLGNNFFESEDAITFTKNEPIWTSKYAKFTQQQLMREFILAKNHFDKNTDFNQFTKAFLPRFKDTFLLNTYVKNLDKYQPELAKHSNILENAIKINHFIDTKIYNYAKKDSVGIMAYLKNNSEKYSWGKRYLLEIYKYQTDSSKDKILKLLKKNKSKENIIAAFKGIKTADNAFELVALTGKIPVDDPSLFKGFNSHKKIQTGTFKNQKAIFRLVEKLEPTLMTIKEAGQRLREEYQEFYYYKTLKKLKKNATISIPLTFKQ